MKEQTEQKQSKKHGPLYFDFTTKSGQARYYAYRKNLIESGIVPPLSSQIWEKFVDVLRQRIKFHNPTISFPSISELADLYKKNQGTIRKAVNKLIDQHLVKRDKGKGGGSGKGKQPNISEYHLLDHPCFQSQRVNSSLTETPCQRVKKYLSESENIIVRGLEYIHQGVKNTWGEIEGNVLEISKTIDGFQVVKNPEYRFSITLDIALDKGKESPDGEVSPEGDKFLTEQIEQKTTPAGDTPATPVEKKESTSTPTKRWKCIHPDFVEFTHLLDKKEVEEVIASGNQLTRADFEEVEV